MEKERIPHHLSKVVETVLWRGPVRLPVEPDYSCCEKAKSTQEPKCFSRQRNGIYRKQSGTV